MQNSSFKYMHKNEMQLYFPLRKSWKIDHGVAELSKAIKYIHWVMILSWANWATFIIFFNLDYVVSLWLGFIFAQLYIYTTLNPNLIFPPLHLKGCNKCCSFLLSQ